MPTTHTDLWQRASARWAEIQAISPDLAPAATLQRQLLRLVLDASTRLTASPPDSLTDAVMADKWRRGVPAMRNEQVPVPESLKSLVVPLCVALADGGAGDAALHIRDAVLHSDIDAGSLLAVSLARNRKAIRTSALHMGFSPDLVWLIGELASSPLAHHLQEQVMERTGSSAFFAFDGSEKGSRPRFSWNRGYCPFCGSWPAFIESCRGARQLRCSFCALAWMLPSHRCVYCGNEREDFVVAAPEMSRSERRIELCATCGNYTKIIEVADMTPFPLLAIEDLASMDLDRAAMNRDYRRPELFDLDSIEPLKPTC